MGTETQSTDPAPSGSQATGTAGDTKQETLNEERIVEIVNRAIGGRLKDNDKKLAKQFEEFGTGLFTKFGTTLDEKLAALAPKPANNGEPDKKTADQVAAFKLEEHPEFVKMQKALKDQERLTRKEQEARAAAESRQRDATLRSSVADALTKSGIGDAVKAKLAANYLIDSDKRVGWEEDRIVFKQEDEAVDLDTGLKNWLKTEEGKHFVPARGSAGSGERPGSGKLPTSAGGEMAIWDALGAAIAATR